MTSVAKKQHIGWELGDGDPEIESTGRGRAVAPGDRRLRAEPEPTGRGDRRPQGATVPVSAGRADPDDAGRGEGLRPPGPVPERTEGRTQEVRMRCPATCSRSRSSNTGCTTAGSILRAGLAPQTLRG